MNSRASIFRTLGTFAAALTIALLPQVANADESSDKAEIASLKQQIYQCRHHKRHHRKCTIKSSSVSKTVEKPVIIERERIIEKPVEVEKKVYVEKEVEHPVVVENGVDAEQRVVVEHSRHPKHLLHLGIPFIGVNLF